MLAGLGQIHIDADVILREYEKNESLAKYEVKKTFAWGGIYGGATGKYSHKIIYISLYETPPVGSKFCGEE
jgi:hypothetical protein